MAREPSTRSKIEESMEVKLTPKTYDEVIEKLGEDVVFLRFDDEPYYFTRISAPLRIPVLVENAVGPKYRYED